MNIHSNKGMYLEELINRTINYLSLNHLAFIEKRNVPFCIVKKINDALFVGKLKSKSFVDYTGNYNGYHLEFEAKQTNKDYFDLHNLKDHQWDFLNKFLKVKNSLAFVVVYFDKNNETYLVPIKTINEQIKNKKCFRFHYHDLKEKSIPLDVIYPGILNLINGLNQLIKT